MKKRIFFFALLFLGSLFLPFVIRAQQESGYALVAISPTSQKAVCVYRDEPSVLSALKQYGFVPKQDETGFIYSLIGYDGPVSSDPAARQAFWGLWVKPEVGGYVFSDYGAAQTKPQERHLYLFYFGSGQAPATDISYQNVCRTREDSVAQPREEEAGSPPNNGPNNSEPTTSSRPSAPESSRLSTADRQSVDVSAEYLKSQYAQQGSSARDWAAIALGAKGVTLSPAQVGSDSVLTLSRNILARKAQGLSVDSQINQLKNSYGNEQFGAVDLINDDIFAVLALRAADPAWLSERSTVFSTIAQTQRPNGSFGYAKDGEGDVDITSAAIWALWHAPERPTQVLFKAQGYIRTAQNSDGGFGFKPNTDSNIASTSWALIALRMLGQDIASAESYLTNERQPDGYWLFGGQPSYLNTAYAVLALSGKDIPVLGQIATPPPAPTPPKPKPRLTPRPLAPKPSSSTSVTEELNMEMESESGCTAHAQASASATGGQAQSSASSYAFCW